MADDIPRYKLTLCGRAGVGKTWILRASTEPEWVSGRMRTSVPTIGCDLRIKHVRSVPGAEASFQIWDTAGTERYATNMPFAYRGAHVIIFVYDITRADSYEAMADILGTALGHAAAGTQAQPLVVVVGNKADLATRRAIPIDQVRTGCAARGYTFLETSAETGAGIDDLWEAIARTLAARRATRIAPPAVPPLRLPTGNAIDAPSASSTGSCQC